MITRFTTIAEMKGLKMIRYVFFLLGVASVVSCQSTGGVNPLGDDLDAGGSHTESRMYGGVEMTGEF